MPDSIKPTLLVIDDESGVLDSLKIIFENDYKYLPALTAAEALNIIGCYDIAVAIIDLGLPDMPGLELLAKIKTASADTECIVLTADTTLSSGIAAMKSGAYDYIVKPFDVDHVILVVKQAVEKVRLSKEIRHRRLNDADAVRPIVGKDPSMLQIYETIDKVASTDVTALIIGESGTGKELVAQAIHNKSARADAPFIAVNCGAIPAELTESELFGHEKGAFTGAASQKLGRFELAEHGTVFLDEISNLPFGLQSKLLRVLQEKTIERVGGSKQIALDVRIVAATNLDLKKLVAEGRFRDDLYYRLNIVPIAVPPLRDRKSDLKPLVKHFIDVYNCRYRKQVKKLPDEMMECFLSYDWPGNVRELENIVQRLLVTSPDGAKLSMEQLPLEMITRSRFLEASRNAQTLAEAVSRFELDCIKAALVRTGYNQTKAAELLGIHPNTVANKLKQSGDKEPKQPQVPLA